MIDMLAYSINELPREESSLSYLISPIYGLLKIIKKILATVITTANKYQFYNYMY